MIEAKLNREFALRLFFVAAVFIGLGFWSFYDGAIVWPRENVRFDEVVPKLVAQAKTPEEWLAKDGDTYPLRDVFMAEANVEPPRKILERLEAHLLPAEVLPSKTERLGRVALSATLFEIPLYSPDKVHGQFIQGALFIVIAFFIALYLAKLHALTFCADRERGLSGNGFGADIKWDEIASIDWSRWETKRIATLVCNDSSRIKLDAWHFKGIKEIVELICEVRGDLRNA